MPKLVTQFDHDDQGYPLVIVIKLRDQFDHDDQGIPLAPLVCSFLTYGQIGKVTFLGKI